jgi:hypothetical protein
LSLNIRFLPKPKRVSINKINIALQIERIAAGTVASGSNVIFDTTVFSAGNISYNNLTGVIKIRLYLVGFLSFSELSGV